MPDHEAFTGIFNILGPVMTGPSSSHTAGAARIGRLARAILGGEPRGIRLHFYGSLARTHRGHLTDEALVAGLLGLEVDDPALPGALELCRCRGIGLGVTEHGEPAGHPNLMKLDLLGPENPGAEDRTLRLTAITLGGGEVTIRGIDGVEVDLRGDRHLLLVFPGEEAPAGLAGRLERELGPDLLGAEAAGSGEDRLLLFTLAAPLPDDRARRLARLPGVARLRSLPALVPLTVRDPRPYFRSFQEMLERAQEAGGSLAAAALEYEVRRSGAEPGRVREEAARVLDVMEESARRGLEGNQRLIGGIADGRYAGLLAAALKDGKLVGGGALSPATARAVAVAEVNAAAGRVVAAPTAGACGVLPGVLLTLGERLGAERERLLDALLAAAGVGVVIAARAPVSGAFGGCQSEVGIASAMAAAAAVVLAGGDAEASAQAAAFALINLMGLVCDPVAGPVEIPCILRNAVGAANALSAADLALAGIRSVIPPDEVVDALRDVQERLPAELRCTLSGGLSSTPTGRRLQAEWLGRLK